MRVPKKLALLVALGAVALLTASCQHDAQGSPSAQDAAKAIATHRSVYVPKNDVEGSNYNKRLQLADDPSTILWCTSFPTNPNSPAITVPIVGKLTSGNKRPNPTEKVYGVSSGDSYNPDQPDANGFYGTSGEYRYGFRPDGQYVDFYNLETYCTTEPTVYQQQHTIIDLGTSSVLNAADAAAQAALRAGDPKKAQQILKDAVGK